MPRHERHRGTGETPGQEGVHEHCCNFFYPNSSYIILSPYNQLQTLPLPPNICQNNSGGKHRPDSTSVGKKWNLGTQIILKIKMALVSGSAGFRDSTVIDRAFVSFLVSVPYSISIPDPSM